MTSVLRHAGTPRVLEVGTGGDAWVNFLPDAYCVGIEPLALELKRRGVGFFSPSARFVCGVGERLPFRSDSFDVVFSYNVLDHMADARGSLDEIRRVMRSEGVLHLLVDTYSLAFGLYRKVYKPDPYHPQTFTLAKIGRVLSSLGFRLALDRSDARPKGRRKNLKLRAFFPLEK